MNTKINTETLPPYVGVYYDHKDLVRKAVLDLLVQRFDEQIDDEAIKDFSDRCYAALRLVDKR